MSSVHYTIFWLMVHLELETIHVASLAIRKCPTTYPIECQPEPSDRCQNDKDCETRFPGQRLICCDNCGRRCVTPDITLVKVAPTSTSTKTTHAEAKTNAPKLIAKCLTNPPSSEFPPGPEQECQNDTICDAKFPGQGLKCCSDGCNFRCMTPVMKSNTETYEVHGTCPVSSESAECPRPADDECHDDSRCRELYLGLELKCCRDGCDMRCVLPIPVIDAKTVIPWSKTKQQTTLSPITKPKLFECPIWPPPAECPPEPYYECNDDKKCSELHPGLAELKCCVDGCDRRCVPPLPVIDTKPDKSVNNAGQQKTPSLLLKTLECPDFPPVAGKCPPEPDDECNDDQRCNELYPGLGLICCIEGCDRRCVPPIPVREIKKK